MILGPFDGGWGPTERGDATGHLFIDEVDLTEYRLATDDGAPPCCKRFGAFAKVDNMRSLCDRFATYSFQSRAAK